MPSPLLSTFRGGENRVTASTMAVFERIDLDLVRELLEKATDSSGGLNAVTFSNQVVGDGSVPDARITAHFAWWFETKTERGTYNSEGHGRSQLRAHARQLGSDAEARLFVLTPDPAAPSWFEVLDGVDEAVKQRIAWFSFEKLSTAIDDVLENSRRQLGEQTRFLLSELRALYEADGLLTNDDTVVVAARVAWPEYLAYSAYVCQPDRTFREGLRYFGFYRHGQIEAAVPRILHWRPVVDMTREEADRLSEVNGSFDVEVATVIRRVLDAKARTDGDQHGVMLLTPRNDERTVHLKAPIANDTMAKGHTWAWTMSQRYTSMERLRDEKVAKTSQL